MIVTEAWELLMNSPKVIRVKYPAFLINLKNGQLTNGNAMIEHERPLHLHFVNLDEEFELVKKFLNDCDHMYIMGEVEDVFRKMIIPSDLKAPGMSINFVRYSFRFISVTNKLLGEWLEQSIHTKAEVAKCQAKKDNG